MNLLLRLLDLIARLLRGTLRKLYALRDWGAMRQQASKRGVVRSTVDHDMFAAPDEVHYQRQYLHWISSVLTDLGREDPASIMDLGCGQGRLLIPLAKMFPQAKCLGMDLSATAIQQAKEYAMREEVPRIVFCETSIEEALAAQEDESVDLLIMTEVTFFMPGWRSALDDVRRVVRAGGVIAVAFRSLYFDGLCLARGRRWEQVDRLIAERKGRIFGGETIFTWQTAEEVRRLFTNDLGMELRLLAGIGCCSGLMGDPHDQIARPSLLSADEAAALLKLELAVARDAPDAGRYMLAIATRPTH